MSPYLIEFRHDSTAHLIRKRPRQYCCTSTLHVPLIFRCEQFVERRKDCLSLSSTTKTPEGLVYGRGSSSRPISRQHPNTPLLLIWVLLLSLLLLLDVRLLLLLLLLEMVALSVLGAGRFRCASPGDKNDAGDRGNN